MRQLQDETTNIPVTIIRISKLKFANLLEKFKNKPEADYMFSNSSFF